MATIKEPAIVLRRLDYSESSQVLAVFTRRQGKVRLIAKGVKRSTKQRFAAGIDLLEIGHAVLSVRAVHQEALATLTEWTQTAPLSRLRDRLDRLYGAQYAAALTAELTEDWDPHPPLFDALRELLHALDVAADVLPLVVAFQRGLLGEIGLAPVFERCVSCGRAVPLPGRVHFSSREGGLLCRDCEPARAEKYELHPAAVDWLRGLPGAPAGLRPAYLTLDYHCAHLLGHRLPLAQMLLAACDR